MSDGARAVELQIPDPKSQDWNPYPGLGGAPILCAEFNLEREPTGSESSGMIAVICAHNPGKRNLGMYSVDLSARDFFAAQGQRCDLVKFTGHRRIGDLRYRIVASLAELDSYDTIVFWGDFQQNPVWGRKNFATRQARRDRIPVAEGFGRWKQMCLLDGRAARASQRVFSVGTCFLGARAALHDPAAVAEYTRLLAGFDAIVPRDSQSFDELRALGLTNVRRGLDCATLLDRDPAPAVSAPAFGYAFGRSLSPEQGDRVARRIEQLTGCRAVPIRWLLKKHALKVCGYRYAAALEVVRSVRCVVTDIYHLAVNTLSLNRDLVCVGRESEDFQDTCDDLKKQLLFRMTNLEHRYVEIPTGSADPVAGVAARVAPFVEGERAASFDTFHRLRSDFRAHVQELLAVR